MLRISTLSLIPLLAAASAVAQLPNPNPTPRVAPRAAWTLTAGVTGTPTQRRDNPGAASDTKMYVFGGRLGNATATVLNALYEFDGRAWTLKTAEGAAGSPPARGGACVAWDVANDRLVVFGGDDGAGNLFGDTWTWDPVTNAWTNATPASPSPSPRRWSAMAYDPTTQGMLLFGGETQISPLQQSAETWLFIGGTWVQLNPATSPPARSLHSLCTRPDFGDAFLCAGRLSGPPETRHLDAWRWSGSDWVQLPTNGTIPHGTTANQAIYDPIRKRVVLQGGQGISVPNTANGGAYGDLYGGSPSTWCSEYDCLTEQWILYGEAGFNTGDPVIGRISRYFGAFVPALGKIYKVSGQNPSGVGTTTATCEYQARPVAAVDTIGAGCSGGGGVVTMAPSGLYDRPWLGRRYDFQVTNLAPGALVIAVVGFSASSLPLSAILPQAGAGCNLEVSLDITYQLANNGGTALNAFLVPTNAALVGQRLYQQALQFEVSGPVLTSFTSSNGLAMSFGAL
jgi:hypothetical protein